MNRFVIDAYAWIEYFRGSLMGEKVKKIIEDPINVVYTNAITFAELSSSFHRNKADFEEAKKVIISLSLFHDINAVFADEAGELHALIKKERRHMGLADVFVLLTARKLNAKVVTGDEDFRDMKEAIMIK